MSYRTDKRARIWDFGTSPTFGWIWDIHLLNSTIEYLAKRTNINHVILWNTKVQRYHIYKYFSVSITYNHYFWAMAIPLTIILMALAGYISGDDGGEPFTGNLVITEYWILLMFKTEFDHTARRQKSDIVLKTIHKIIWSTILNSVHTSGHRARRAGRVGSEGSPTGVHAEYSSPRCAINSPIGKDHHPIGKDYRTY